MRNRNFECSPPLSYRTSQQRSSLFCCMSVTQGVKFPRSPSLPPLVASSSSIRRALQKILYGKRLSSRVAGCGCTGCSCAGGARPLPALAHPSPVAPPAVIQPVAAPLNVYPSAIPRDPFSPPASSHPFEMTLPESPTFIALPAEELLLPAENKSGLKSGPYPPSPEKSEGSTQRQQHQNGNLERGDSAADSGIAQPSSPPSYMPQPDQRPQVMVPMMTASLGPKPNRQGPASPTKGLKSTPSLSTAYADSPYEKPGSYGESTISKSGYDSSHVQIQVKSSDLSTEAAYSQPLENGDAKPMFMTYHNQECTGVMVHMTVGTSIIAATEECLVIGCEAINAKPQSGSLYTFTYLTTARGRINRKGSHCMSLQPVSAQRASLTEPPSGLDQPVADRAISSTSSSSSALPEVQAVLPHHRISLVRL